MAESIIDFAIVDHHMCTQGEDSILDDSSSPSFCGKTCREVSFYCCFCLNFIMWFYLFLIVNIRIISFLPCFSEVVKVLNALLLTASLCSSALLCFALLIISFTC